MNAANLRSCRRGGAQLGLVAAALGSLLACGTETGNPELVEVRYNATSSDQARVAVGDSGEATRVGGVWIGLDDLALHDCDGAVVATLPALGLADHAGVDAALQIAELPSTPLCGLHTAFLVVSDGPDDAPAVADGASLALTGTRSDGVAFEVRSERRLPVHLTLDEVVPAADRPWLLAFDVATWLVPAELDALAGGPIRVGADTEAATLAAIEARVQDGVQLFEDEDADGRVQPGDVRLDR